MKTTSVNTSTQQGFTLVELAIVMVIIGLLIGGVLKGQELIANARVSSTVTQVKSVDAAINTFFDKYAAYPGDMIDPDLRLPNCTATGDCSGDGDNDTRIEGSGTRATVAPLATTEAARAFVHLSAADLYGGINANGGAFFGGVYPTLPVGGGMWVSYSTAITMTSLPAARHYAVLNGSVANVGNGSGVMSGLAAAQIDRKLDDGRPNAGAAQVTGTGCRSDNTATGTYTETGGGTCALAIRVLN